MKKPETKTSKSKNEELNSRGRNDSGDEVDFSESDDENYSKDYEKYDPFKMKFEKIKAKKKMEGKNTEEEVPCLKMIKLDKLLLAEEELFKIDSGGSKIAKTADKIIYLPISKKILIFIDNTVLLFNGSFPYERETEIQVPFPRAFGHLYSIGEDPFGKVWIGWKNIISIYDINTMSKETSLVTNEDKSIFHGPFIRKIEIMPGNKIITNESYTIRIFNEDYEKVSEITNFEKYFFNLCVLDENSFAVKTDVSSPYLMKYDIRENRWIREKAIEDDAYEGDFEKILLGDKVLYWMSSNSDRKRVSIRTIGIEDFTMISYVLLDLNDYKDLDYYCPNSFKKNLWIIPYEKVPKLYSFSKTNKYYDNKDCPFAAITAFVKLEEDLVLIVDGENNFNIVKIEEE